MTILSRRPLGQTGFEVAPIGFGSFKIGRNQGIKYPQPYDLPDDRQVEELVDGLLELGVNLFDTAPAYGLAEERLGNVLGRRREEIVLSTKVGERFENGESTYDFTPEAIRTSVETSLKRLQTDRIDLLFLHSPGNDLVLQHDTDAVPTLMELKRAGKVRAIGLSGKTVAGARESLKWADVVMVEYHARDESHEDVIAEAHDGSVGVLVKKGLASGHLPANEAIGFVLDNSAVDCLVLGGLNLRHFRDNCAVAAEIRG